MIPAVIASFTCNLIWLFSPPPPGFIVLGIDYFFGDAINLHADEEGFDRRAWITKSRPLATEAFPKWLKEVRQIYGRY